MATIAPFRALRPKPEFAARVAAPPYDVVSLDEAREIAAGNPYSFLRVSRAELLFSDGVDPYSASVYQRGADCLRGLIAEGVLTQEKEPLLGVYRQSAGAHRQTGLVALASIAEYDRGIIKKHEYTQPIKETDRVRIIEAHESQSGPALLFFRDTTAFNRWVDEVTGAPADVRFVADDGVEHSVWSVRDPSLIERIVGEFRAVDALYIADGHHRSAAASRVLAERGNSNKPPTCADEDGFLAVIFPHAELQILPYNRLVRDLNGLEPLTFVGEVSASFELEPTSYPGNPPPRGFDMYLEGQWHRAAPRSTADTSSGFGQNPIHSLPVSVLSARVLEPLLGIADQRSDSRIDFVGGIRGPAELSAAVDSGDWALAFWLYPTTVEELMAVSDTGSVMPPKSTWFEPKLRDGLFIHLLRED